VRYTVASSFVVLVLAAAVGAWIAVLSVVPTAAAIAALTEDG
jgi:hypothetical protein